MKLSQNKPLVLALCVFAVFAGVMTAKYQNQKPTFVSPQNVTIFNTPRAWPPFALTDHFGKPFTNDRLVGQWSIVFFGFTHCPDVCPTTLAMLASTQKLIGTMKPAAGTPQVFMFSVDPERDTVEKIAGYVPFFDPTFIGVTGSVDSIENLATTLGVAHNKVPTKDGSYTVDHTSALFLINPEGHWVAISSAPHRPEVLANDYVLLSES